jgi:hypothetical protein
MSKGAPMPEEFEALSIYNEERSRGVAHTPEYDAKMADLQERFKQWRQEVGKWADDVERFLTS